MAHDPEHLAHLEWLGYVQPVGVVVSIPALLAAQAQINRHIAPDQQRLLACLPRDAHDTLIPEIRDFAGFAEQVLGWESTDLIPLPETAALPEDLAALEVTLPEYHETLRPTYGVREFAPQAGQSPWLLLIQCQPVNTELDAPMAESDRSWHASPHARFERLLRETGVSIGLLCNGTHLRLVYAPRGETSGFMTFAVAEMVQVAGRPIFASIRDNDLLVHHPYDSFEASVEHFIRAAADDPQTIAIKMTVYRIGDDTPFVTSLITAAEAGKQVACVIELQARFDEERNLHWAAELERAGAHVIFGVRGLKTHAKMALVVRQEPAGLCSYAHIGTGNYHTRTARLYTDVGLFTCDPALTRDVVNLFHYLTGHAQAPHCQTLLVAPATMRARFLALIQREADNQRAGRPARIVAKMNQLEDPAIIEALCDAAGAGVEIDLVIRGICCLRPGIAGQSEGIRVRSIIGRFLEHSRIFHFAAGHADPLDGEFYLGSADWMFRNLSRRVEVVTPVTAPGPKQRLWEILDIGLRDHRQAWILNNDGRYAQLHPEGCAQGSAAVGTHHTLMELTRRRSHLLAR